MKMWQSVSYLCFFVIAVQSAAFVDPWKIGKCPEVSPIHLHEGDLSGRWYEIKAAHLAKDADEDCIYSDISFEEQHQGSSYKGFVFLLVHRFWKQNVFH